MFQSGKIITFYQKVTNYPKLVNKCTEIILILQNMLIYVLFIDCPESHLRAFCRQIHQCARIGGWEGGVKPILAMPGFWKRLSLHAPPYGKYPCLCDFLVMDGFPKSALAD